MSCAFQMGVEMVYKLRKRLQLNWIILAFGEISPREQKQKHVNELPEMYDFGRIVARRYTKFMSIAKQM